MSGNSPDSQPAVDGLRETQVEDLVEVERSVWTEDCSNMLSAIRWKF